MASVVITREPKITHITAGSLAYDLSYIRENEAEFIVPDERVYNPEIRRPRPKPQARTRYQVRARQKIAPVTLIGFLLVGVCLVVVLLSHIQLMELSDQVVSLRNELTSLETEEENLIARYESAYDMSAVESIVTQDGRMIQPRTDQIYYVDLGLPDNAIVYTNANSGDDSDPLHDIAEGFTGALEYLK